MGHGHSGDSSGRSADESNQYVINQLNGQVQKYANSLGLNLTPDDISGIIDKVYPQSSRFTSGTVFDADRGNALQDAMNFILPAVSQYKFNPTATTDQTTKAGDVIQQTFGRAATPDEAAYFAKELAQGKSPYELQQELQSLPEYQKMQAQNDRNALAGDLLNQQQIAFQKAQPQIIASFMRSGRLNSSGLNSALAKAQGELEQQRQGFLGQAGYQDASNIRNQAYNAFQNYNQQFAQTYNPGAQVQNQFGMLGNAINRQQQLQDYYRQQNDYNNYLNQQTGQANRAALYGLGGAALGAGIQGAFSLGKQ